MNGENASKWQNIKSIIKDFLKKIDIKKAITIILFFLSCYISMELLNGGNINFTRIFSFSYSWSEKFELIKDTVMNFFVYPKFIFNLLVLIFLYFVIYGITNKTKLSCIIVSVFIMIFSMINYFITGIRGIALTISDVYGIRTAANVSSAIKLHVDGNFVIAIILFLITIFIILKCCNFKEKERKSFRVMRFALGTVGIICIYMSESIVGNVGIWNINEAYENSGACLTIMKLIKDLKVNRPDNYSVDYVDEVLSYYTDDDKVDIMDLPNVIVIMNESFSDLEEVFDLNLSEDCIPNYHNIVKGDNVVSGVMHSSKYGGGTANVEYEFLTQNTTAFLPAGAMPYQQYINKRVKQAIPTHMNELGYNSYGIHSWYKSGYSRAKIYNLLEFNTSMFYEDMPNLELDQSGYASDSSTYEYVYDILRNKDKNERDFSFVVTVQNHLPYTNGSSDLTQYVEDDFYLNSYLQYLHRSDYALGGLIDFLENFDEDTVLLFFGDHQPNIDLDKNYGSNGKYSEEELLYVVPFFAWANYDIEKQEGIVTSTNYLQNILFDVAQIPKDAYTKYVADVRKDIPVITAQYYIDRDGNKYNVSDDSSPYYDKVKEYWNIVYYQMFGNK